VYQNETRLIGRPTLPVIITETGWSRDFCTEEERAGWQVSAWQAWYDDPQLLAACPFNLEGPRYATPQHATAQHATPTIHATLHIHTEAAATAAAAAVVTTVYCSHLPVSFCVYVSAI
jgi:hypothetical protein